MIAKPLLAWFRANRRDLPWRDEPRDPYRVWVSEVMLQQTRVETVVRYYEPFLVRFPDVRALASAHEDDVMKAWEGLGYYRRARLLHQGARVVVAQHGGEVPRTLAALREIPGMGAYTSGAVASLAFGIATPAVDGNVLRVASRILALEEDIKSSGARELVELWAAAQMPRKSPGDFNEALMELGATVCTPRAPRCDACPLADHCVAYGIGRVEDYPVKAPKEEPRVVRVAVGIARRGDLLLVEKRESGLLAGTWGLPLVDLTGDIDPRRALVARVKSMTGGNVAIGPAPVRRARHAFTHRVWEIDGYEITRCGNGGSWESPERVALATAFRKVLLPEPDPV